ncbi:MAG: ABC transporter permease [Candidatus Thermoplasmatota archaeon]|nr:ABC transporter permease [Candidatus Thermoplasmatota archaeon]MBS3790351.1 ABC transporter permease [Candidatus Thermoplasmatota archaeon]
MTGDLLHVTLLSIFVSVSATLLASAMAVPLGTIMGLRKFRGREVIRTVTYTLYGFPPVVAGLLIYLLISSQGPLGSLDLLFTPTAMILAQMVLVFPIVTGLTMSSVSQVAEDVKETAMTLGADRWQTAKTVLNEARIGVISAIMIGFGRAIAEVGAVIIVGGNIKWHTRVLTTAIVLETRRGNFEYALMLGVVLLSVALFIFFILKRYQEKGVKM